MFFHVLSNSSGGLVCVFGAGESKTLILTKQGVTGVKVNKNLVVTQKKKQMRVYDGTSPGPRMIQTDVFQAIQFFCLSRPRCSCFIETISSVSFIIASIISYQVGSSVVC